MGNEILTAKDPRQRGLPVPKRFKAGIDDYLEHAIVLEDFVVV
jgi:hypothetical protein